MLVRPQEAEVILKQDGVIGKKIGVANSCEYVEIIIKCKKGIAAHTLDIPVTFYITSGEGKLTLDGEAHHAAAGDLIEIKPGLMREWHNEGPIDLELLVIKHL